MTLERDIVNTQRTAGKRGLNEPFSLLRGVAPVAPYLTSLAAPPPSVDYEHRADFSYIAMNDQLGCCTISGMYHVYCVQSALVGTQVPYPGDQAIETTYYGLTGGPDTGLPLQTVVNAASTTGMWGHKLDAAGSVHPHDTTTLKQVIDIFGAAYAAGLLPDTAESQFEQHVPWSLEPGSHPGTGGHCFDLVGYDQHFLYAATWGGIQPVTYNWWRYYGTQAIAPISDFYQAAGKGPVANFATMLTDLKVVTR